MTLKQICTYCKQEKELDSFHADKRTANGKRTQCIECRNKHIAITNLSTFEYAKLLVAQDNACAICKVSATELRRELSVDHNHDTGAIRGLLCSACNTGLGLFKDNTRFLFAAIEYLEQSDGSA